MITENVCEYEDEDGGSYVSNSKRDSLNLNSLDFWDYSVELEYLKGPEDLQLAAELGKTLLERNKELEQSIKDYQRAIDDQSKEIEYLTKQAAALRKTNDNRIRIYEHLEVSIQELERANQKLALDNSADKKQIKSLCAYRDTLESRCEELQKALDEAREQQNAQKKQIKRLMSSKESQPKATAVSQTSIEQNPVEEELINQLTKQNQELANQLSRDQRKVADLEEKLSRQMQDITLLTEELNEKDIQISSLRSKMSILEDVRSENYFEKCCKDMDINSAQKLLLLNESNTEEEQNVEEDGDSVQLESKEDNPYKNLVEMYQSLASNQWENKQNVQGVPKNNSVSTPSLKDELQLFYRNREHVEEEELPNQEKRLGEKGNFFRGKACLTTGADFSEEETSSGFSDETCNKSTQTERNTIPGSFLCSIADGDDCKFSIYDDACPIESRFRKIPEYRTLFREIFAVLKRAAEAKSNGERLPLLDDLTPVSEAPKVPPVTPANEDPPIDFDDVKSLPESEVISEAVSETVSETSSTINDKVEDDTLKDSIEDDNKPSTAVKDISKTKDFLEYISVSVVVKKKHKQKRKSFDSPHRKAIDSPHRKPGSGELSESLPNSPRRSGGRRRKEWRNDTSQPDSRTQSPAVQPHILTTLRRRESQDSPYKSSSPWSFQPFVSTAAMEVAKLKKLDKSYAEVLRLNPKNLRRSKGVSLVS